MCGELEDWEKAERCTVRMTGTANQFHVLLSRRIENIERVELDEYFFHSLNGGIATCCYLQFDQPGFLNGTSNNERKNGTLLSYNPANAHVVYNRPRIIAQSHMGYLSEFFLTITQPSGATSAFTEAAFMMTFICRKSPDEHAATRKMKGLQPYPPTIVDVANTYHP